MLLSRQGFAAHSFDAVVAVNVLHATQDLVQTLTNVHRSLKAGGLLVLSELTEVTETAQTDCTWGLTEGWWLFNDGRKFAPQSREQWNGWFSSTGFELVPGAAQPASVTEEVLEGQTMFVAQAICHTSSKGCQLQCSTQQHEGLFLVTGGLGGVGLVTAQWLSESLGVHGLMLTSRGGNVKDASDQSALNVLQQFGCMHVDVTACDVKELDQIEMLTIAKPNLVGVIHSVGVGVGVLSDSVIENQKAAAFRTVTRPKVDGVRSLHELTQNVVVDSFVVYSSIAGVIAALGQSPHASANTALDSFVDWRRGLGQAALGLQWGAWAQIGYAARVGADAMADKGDVLPSFVPSLGLQALQTAWVSSCTLTVTPITSSIGTMLQGTQSFVQGLDYVLGKRVATACSVLQSVLYCQTRMLSINGR